jgi:hypothetical protein
VSAAQRLIGVAAGLVLAALPFWHYAHEGSHTTTPHADHEPRHGGRLVMVGDHHLEWVRRRGRLELFVSDALRNPLRPAGAWLRVEGVALPMRWQDHRLVAAEPGSRTVEVELLLADGTRLSALAP